MRSVPNPYIIDVESSGMGLHSYPIEVGLALDEDSRYCSLITPVEEWTYWEDRAEAIHNISRDQLIDAGKSVKSVAVELNTLLDGKFVFSDGWVVDEPWVIRLFDAAKIERKFRIYDLQTILTEKQMNAWHTVKDQVIADFDETRHRASNDAFVLQETYRRTLKLI